MIQELNVPPKLDSQEKLAATQNIPDSEKLMASEINSTVAKVNELVAEANNKTDNLDNANDIKYPTAKAVADGDKARISKEFQGELQVTATGDIHNLEPAGKGLFSFINAVTITGINTNNFFDGQVVSILNVSTGLLNITHLSNQSLPANRIFIPSGQDISLKPSSFIFLRYSNTRNRLEVINVFGTDLLPSLAYAGNEQRVVTVTPEGVCFAEPIMEYEVFDETTTGYNTLASIVAAYPTSVGRKKGFQVWCYYMAQPTLYKKCGDGDDSWLKVDTQITKMI